MCLGQQVGRAGPAPVLGSGLVPEAGGEPHFATRTRWPERPTTGVGTKGPCRHSYLGQPGIGGGRMLSTSSCDRRRPWLAAVAATVLALVLGGLLAPSAIAVEPFSLQDQITDQVGAVAGREGEIRAALNDLEDQHGIRMWVVFVETFGGPDPQAWADATFKATGLGEEDYLLAVATADRAYGYVVEAKFSRTDAALARVAAAAERHLAENPALAVVAAARELGARGAATDGQGSTAGSVGSGTSAGDDESSAWDILSFLAVGVGIVLVMANGIRRVRRGLPFFAPSGGRSNDSWSGRDHPSWGSGGGSSSGGGSGTRGGSGSF